VIGLRRTFRLPPWGREHQLSELNRQRHFLGERARIARLRRDVRGDRHLGGFVAASEREEELFAPIDEANERSKALPQASALHFGALTGRWKRDIMQKLVKLIAAISLAVAMLASQPVAANAATVVGRINGGGMAMMEDGMGVSTFGFEATLFSDGSARGHFDCVDQMGDTPGYPGNIFGEITSWSRNPTTGAVSLYVTDGKLVSFPNGLVVPGGLPFTVTIQTFGGAGIGHWTLDVPGIHGPLGPICVELLISGQIAARWN